MDKEWAKKVFAVLLGVVMSDNELSPNEAIFLGAAQLRLDLNDKDRNSIQPLMDPEAIAATFADFPAEHRGAVLELVVTATVADGKVAPEEQVVVNALRAALQA